jgi:hypothetical protein
MTITTSVSCIFLSEKKSLKVSNTFRLGTEKIMMMIISKFFIYLKPGDLESIKYKEL